MTLQMLEYFVALAEKGSFTDAAAACFVTQPALSRAIATLEQELGCVLVDRDKRKNAVLTPAGRTLLVEARRVFRQLDVMRERVCRMDRHSRREITMGYIAFGILRDFRKACTQALSALSEGGIFLKSVYGSSSEIRERVLSGELDCAVLVESSTYDMPGCRVIPVYEAEKRIMIPRGHPLFGRESVSLAELADTPFVTFDPTEHPLIYASNIEICRRAGITPHVVDFGFKTGDLAGVCHLHGAVALVSTSFDYAQTEDLRIVRIEDPFIEEYRTTHVLVMLENPVNPLMETVAAAIEGLQHRDGEKSGHDKK